MSIRIVLPISHQGIAFKTMLLILLASTMSKLHGQGSVLFIDGGMENAGRMETTINGDTAVTGERNDPNRIYILRSGEPHIQKAPVVIHNPEGTLTIKGEEGKAFSVIRKIPDQGTNVGNNVINSNLVVKNIQYQTSEEDGYRPWFAWTINGEEHDLLVENCLVENCNGGIFNMNAVYGGCNIIIRNCYFRDFHQGANGQWWGSRVVQCKVPVDTFMFENNTITGGGLTVLGQECLFDYTVINHNTFINNHKYPFLNQYWRECYFTNNLFVNANWVGEDYENVVTGGSLPNFDLRGITGIDTIGIHILLPGRYLNEDSTAIVGGLDDISTYVYFAADNILVSSSEFDYYYSGGYNENPLFDAPESWLTWSGVEGPFQVVNIPGIWMNDKSLEIIHAQDNLRTANNSVYQMTVEDLGFATSPLTQEQADVLIQWNRTKWEVPGVMAPSASEFKVVYFGDSDNSTVPGVETEDGSGIRKISDMMEDFSYSANLVSKSDGLPIGALHWDDLPFDPKNSLEAIKEAYRNFGTSYHSVNQEKWDMDMYPNPVKDILFIRLQQQVDDFNRARIINMFGQVLIDTRLINGVNELEFSALAQGLYYLQLYSENNGIRLTNQVVKL